MQKGLQHLSVEEMLRELGLEKVALGGVTWQLPF